MDSESEEINIFTFEEIKKINIDNLSINQINNCLIDLEEEREKIENNINFLWEKVMLPYIDYKAELILSKDINNIKLDFYQLLYNNTNIEKKIIELNQIINTINNKY
jgi:hypothetical protein